MGGHRIRSQSTEKDWNFSSLVIIFAHLIPKVPSMNKIRFLLVGMIVSLTAACTGGSENPPASSDKSASSSTSGDDAPAVDNEDLTPGLKGIDADNNGIRDDIDRFIARYYSGTSMMKKVAEREARAFQKSMEATTGEAAQAAGNAIFLAGDCAYKLLPHATGKDMKIVEDMSIEIKALTANTKERFEAYWRGEALASGMVFRVNDDPVCE